ncbi:MAG: DUF805 domain-containing protein [Betaproteobacteria bacterium]|nr:DUF805 domain-containing protein [Betaproteobacteria bacterium]
MLKQLRRLLFSFNGRISRSTFWWTLLLLGFVFIVLFVFLDRTAGYASTLILYPPLLWALAALATKRLRDRGKSPLWFLVAPIPVFGILWLFVELGLRKGSAGENQYGRDPLEEDHDYLTVS